MSADRLDLPAFLDRRPAIACLRCRAQFAPSGFAIAGGCAQPECPIGALCAERDVALKELGPIDLPNFLHRQ